MQELQKVQEIVQQLNIIDDTLFQKMAEDPEFCEETISTILQQKVIVKKVTPQNSVKNLQGRSVVLDALCELENGEQEIYVNTKIDDGTDVAELMCIFTETNAYDFAKFPKVSKRKKQFKTNEGGKQEVCDLVENYAKECAEKAAKEAAEIAAKEAAEKATKEAVEKAAKEAIEKAADSALKLFENGVSYEVVRASITSLSDEELQAIYEKVKKTE